LDIFENALKEGKPIVEESHLLESFIEATRAALAGMADIEVSVKGMVRKTLHRPLGDIVAVVGLTNRQQRAIEFDSKWSSDSSQLALGFSQTTAAALAGRILTGVANEINENLIRDCMGEIANVLTGQAKALLGETSYRFMFSLPPLVMNSDEVRPTSGLDCLIVVFTCEQGEFAMQMFLRL
jgi:CheY-specific phosphatase CheX